ncbi:MAG: hypothetical protein IKB09_10800 [Oscillospiraceae bacterium]|nr:hypothetical protein [Oscillospiraceae bacterium]
MDYTTVGIYLILQSVCCGSLCLKQLLGWRNCGKFRFVFLGHRFRGRYWHIDGKHHHNHLN